MDLLAVAAEIEQRLKAIPGLKTYSYPPDSVQPPAAVVSYPERIEFDRAAGRGVDSITLPIVIVVGRVHDRTTYATLARFCAGSGTHSVKAVLEAGPHTAFDVARVSGVEFDAVTISAVDWMAALFTVDIAGKGS